MIAEEAFVPTDSGGRSESLAMLRALAASGIHLHVLVPGLDGSGLADHRSAVPGAAIEALPRRTGKWALLSRTPYVLASRPVPPDLAAAVRSVHARGPFTAVVALTFRVVHLGEVVAEALDLPFLVRPHNLESAYFADLARSSRGLHGLAYRLEAAKLRRVEARAYRSSRIALFADISAADARRRSRETRIPVRHEPPFLPAPLVTPGGGSQAPAPAPRDGRPRLLFVGSMDNANNRSAVDWFIERCWPELRAVADLDVVGRRFPETLRARLVAQGARVTADAPSVEPYLLAATVFVNPMRRGSGVNIKMVEAMAAGLPVVSTPAGARGLAWRDGEHLLIANEPHAFTAAVRALITEPDRRSAVADGGRAFVLRHLDPDHRVAALRNAVELPTAPAARFVPLTHSALVERPGALS